MRELEQHIDKNQHCMKPSEFDSLRESTSSTTRSNCSCLSLIIYISTNPIHP